MRSQQYPWPLSQQPPASSGQVLRSTPSYSELLPLTPAYRQAGFHSPQAGEREAVATTSVPGPNKFDKKVWPARTGGFAFTRARAMAASFSFDLSMGLFVLTGRRGRELFWVRTVAV